MKTLVLLRHGQSTWNKENRFTGWVDVPLSEQGVDEAFNAARLLRNGGYTFDVAFTSVLKRAIKTLWIVLEEMDFMWLPVHRTWRLNERHYENFYRYVTGNNLSLEELLSLSNDVYDLTRLINTRLGVNREDDTLPYKVHACPVLTGPNAGKVIDREEFQESLSLYYRKRGWDEDGLPPPGVEEKHTG